MIRRRIRGVIILNDAITNKPINHNLVRFSYDDISLKMIFKENGTVCFVDNGQGEAVDIKVVIDSEKFVKEEVIISRDNVNEVFLKIK